MRQDSNDLDSFRSATDSLKLYRRAGFEEFGKSNLVDQLYVDPLPNNHVLLTALRPNTTFIIGRKGTGKSTIFQRLQSELRKSNDKTSAYIDIKSIFESSQVSQETQDQLAIIPNALRSDDLERLLIYRTFIGNVISEIKTQLRTAVEESLWKRIREVFGTGLKDLFDSLDDLVLQANKADFVTITGLKTSNQVAEQESKRKVSDKANLEASFSTKPSLKSGLTTDVVDSSSSKASVEDSEVLMRVFNVKDFMTKLKTILSTVRIRNIYILIDDFSELPLNAMKVIVDVLLAPLNNWSDEFIKFKVAAYPGRLYYGAIDKTKIDEIPLDIYDLYGSGNISQLEVQAKDFVRRLVEGRLEHFCGERAEKFFSSRDMDEVWEQLFYSSMANPRILGYILQYTLESHLIHRRSIGVQAIREAARRYYKQKIESYFNIGRFLNEAFNERSSVFSLKVLLEQIVSKARQLRSHASEVIKKIPGRPPTSHFYIVPDLEPLLSTLELNFFVTKYFQMVDRDGRKVSIYALNYGLCGEYTIEFGRPIGEREFRLYFVERIFDYSGLLRQYMKENQEIACDECGTRFSPDDLGALQRYKMKCPECPNGYCKVTNLSKKYEDDLRKIGNDVLLPEVELRILDTLNAEGKPLKAGDIAAELDYSRQLVGWRGKNLADRGLIDRKADEQGQRVYELTQDAKKLYFASNDKSGLTFTD